MIPAMNLQTIYDAPIRYHEGGFDSEVLSVFGIKDALLSGAFGVAFLTAGALVSLLGTRELIALAGAGALVVWLAAVLLLRRSWPADVPAPAQAQA